MSKIQASSALSNLRVLDMSRVRAGPNCVRLLADFGADVIRIEPPKGVDPNEGMFAGNREGGDFQNLNRNKRAMTLNLKKPGALDIMMRLVKTADVVVENWRPDIKKKLGIDYESLAKVNPRIILASISGFGQEGPYASRPGFDQIMQGMGGLMSVTGIPGQGPVRAGLAVADMSAGLYAGIGILTALLERERSGKGQWVHASLLHAQIAMMDFQAARYLNEGDVAGQAGNDHPTSTPMGLFEASDGSFNLGASGQGNWVRLCELIGHPEWIADPDFANEKSRTVNRVRCNKLLSEVFKSKPVEYWVEALNNAGVPAGPVYNVPQMFADKHVKQANISKMVKDKAGKEKGFITQPAVLSRTPADVVTTAPQWGEHTQEVLSEVGYSAEEIAKFQEQGIV
ncbi:CaiB/BaiF CoA transferase family protein [Zwartia vadi]|uniref:CaiB/BaiF CoA transferase family protein n=1 Tax=Zwartia vadi TaxID=3058168 RepID=UPI0025B5CB40|nr:CoA transferase [Zwartia vadi]MDN3986938.1 CoA transferase [Zwartia vadi]